MDRAGERPADPLYVAILKPLLSTWPVFILLVLLFAMGVRKKDGLWSTQQPWTGNGVHVAYAPPDSSLPLSSRSR